MRVDLTGVFFAMKHQIRAMLRNGRGSIVNTSSTLGLVAWPQAADYVAAKHGVLGLTKAAALDYSARKIRINAVMPGTINTPMVRRLNADLSMSANMKRLVEHHPIGRFGEPNEVGEAVKWLLSDASSFVTGAALAVDGGFLTI